MVFFIAFSYVITYNICRKELLFMDRVKIKEAAKAKIKGNKWNIIWPVLVIGVLESVVETVLGLNPYNSINLSNPEAVMNYQMPTNITIGISIVSIIFGIIMVAYKKYILNFVRGNNFDFNDIIDCVKEKWLNILIAEILTTIIVSICSLFFVVPGIIMGLAYSMVAYLVIDTDVTGSDSLKASREMMKGYKWDRFVFYLSFIGWILLVPFTLGILLIWLFPYITVADAMYYDELKKIKKK